MKRSVIGICALFLVLAFVYLATDNSSAVAKDPASAAEGKPVPLFNSDAKLEPATVEDTPTALITRVADRGRDRHAREGMFKVYEHFIGFYFEFRTSTIEIVDTVAKGGDSITFNMTSLVPLHGPNLRAFFSGTAPNAYSHNAIAKQVDPLHYTYTLKHNPIAKRPIKIGDRIEIEWSVFLDKAAIHRPHPSEDRIAYYGTPLLYVVGTPGIQPWEGIGRGKDSFPLPELARLGGDTTSHQSYSNEPQWLFDQLATNMAPINAQPFMLGRRLAKTDFGTGVHSEPQNPVFTEMIGKLGPHFTERSCVACHAAMPAAVGKPLVKYLVRVGSDAKGTPHPQLGSVLQVQADKGLTPEGSVSISGWTISEGTYGDGTPFSLQKPTYKFTGSAVPEFYSVRIAITKPIGMGLLEAIDENTIAALAADNAGHMGLVTDPENGQLRMGRFGYKASQASLKHQVAKRLNDVMSITTSIFPNPDRGSDQPDVGPVKKLDDADFENLYRYYSLRAVPPRRDFRDEQVLKGEKLFLSAKCDTCHTPTQKTSPYHPMAELRNQTIHPYTDLLLHDMGRGLADNMGEGNATGAQWRTPPLWGLGLVPATLDGEAYLHDGRARNLSEAILWHGGQSYGEKEAFRKMPAEDRAALIKFLKSL